jgi:outer membrane protein OmpA-like peptidoglycan-associated protein
MTDLKDTDNWIISGHTDNTGTKEHNAPLSLARAQSVGSWLEHHEIDAARYTAVGIGADRPVANNATAGGRALNRRVELQRQD